MSRGKSLRWLALTGSLLPALAVACSSTDDPAKSRSPGEGEPSGGRTGGAVTPNGGVASTRTSGGTGPSGGGLGEGGIASGGRAGTQPAKISLKASGVPFEVVQKSVIDPSADEYEGMGQHSGESVVLGLKIKLTGISLGENPPGQPGGQGQIFDWSASPRELAIENGFAGSIEDTAPLNLPPGRYAVVQVSYLSQYDLKAYAYLDTDKDGEVETTIYTTTAGVQSLPRIARPDELLDLDYKHYGFTYTHNADSPIATTTTSFDFTLTPTLFTVGELPSLDGAAGAASDGGESGGQRSTAAGAGAGGSDTEDALSNDLSITLFIDAYRVVKAWDGVPPSNAADHVDVLFPQGSEEARSNGFGVDLVDLYPLGQPTFGLQYLPTFAFANAAEYAAETYLLAPSEPFLVANTQTLSVIFDDEGRPVIGRASGNVDAQSLQLGQAARMFEPAGDDDGEPLYRYYVEYGIRDADNVDDGGLYYHNDKSMAGHIVSGFRRLDVGETASIAIGDGPRCNAEYNRCLGDRSGVLRRVR